MRQFIAALALFVCAQQLHATCGATTFTPQRTQGCQALFGTTPPTHNALYITDPAGEQTAIFDMEWGGTLASLKYNGQELFWGHDTGGMVQPALHHGQYYGYNPQQAGDWGEKSPNNFSRGAPAYGGACKDGSLLLIYSAALDDAQNNKGFYSRAAGVRNEQVVPRPTNPDYLPMWFAPYAFTTIATFVPSGNPAGTGPQYYLKVDQSVVNTDGTEGANMQKSFGFSFEMAMYMPGTPNGNDSWHWNLNTCGIDDPSPNAFKNIAVQVGGCGTYPCPALPASSVPKLLVGGYTDTALTNGVAVSSNAAKYFGADSRITVNASPIVLDDFWNNAATRLKVEGFFLPPLTGRRYVHYFMAGPAARAKAFNPQ